MFSKISNTQKVMIGSQVLLIIIIVMMARSCSEQKAIAELNQYKLDEYLDERQEFVTTIGNQGAELASQEEVILAKDREIEKKLLENSELQRLNRQIKINMETRIDSLIAKYSGSGSDIFITQTDTIHDTTFVQVPIGVKFGTPFSVNDQWYYTGGKITQEGVLFDSLSFINDLTITVGRKRDGWFKPMKTMVEVRNENPYTGVTGLNNVNIQKEKDKLINKPWFTFLLGTGTGFLIGVLAE